MIYGTIKFKYLTRKAFALIVVASQLFSWMLSEML